MRKYILLILGFIGTFGSMSAQEYGSGPFTLNVPSGGTNIQWYLDGSPIASATNATYATSTVGVYWAEYDVAAGCTDVVTESHIIISENNYSGTILNGPVGQSNYQWYLDGNPIAGATNATIDLVAIGSNADNTTDGTYRLDYDNGTCVISTGDMLVYVLDDCITFTINVLLSGAYNSVTGLMSTNLNTQHGLPGQDHDLNPFDGFNLDKNHTPIGQPFNSVPWNYTGTEGDGFGDPNTNSGSQVYPTTVTDWVLVSLREETTDASSEVWKAAGLLHSDGTVEFVENCLSIDATKAHYVVVEHRNHLPVMSATAVSVIGGVLTMDFTVADSWIGTAFGNSFGVGQLNDNGLYLMYPGNGFIDSYSAEKQIDARDFGYVESVNGSLYDYSQADHNLDGRVNAIDLGISLKYNGHATLLPQN